MKICIILLNTIFRFDYKWYIPHKNGYAPLTLALLASQVPPELNAEIEVIDEGVKLLNKEKIQADLVAMSVLTPLAPRAYSLASYFRSKGITVVLGGVHVSLLPDEASQHADAIVVGHSDVSWKKLLLDFTAGNLQKVYNYEFANEFTSNFIIPDRKFIHRKKYLMPDTIEISRGCLNNCNFCVIPVTCNRRQSFRPVADVIAEIKTMNKRYITFIDSSPFDNRNYMLEFLTELIPLGVKWYSNASMKIAGDYEMFELMQKSGCKGIMIGFESLSADSLQKEGKFINKTSQYKQIISDLHKHRIFILGSFMFGMDGNEKSIFNETLEFINKSKLEAAHLAIYTPFPGTPDFVRLEKEGRILTKDWSKYDGRHVVFQPENMSIRELESGYFKLYKNAHNWSSILKRNWNGGRISIYGLMLNMAFKYFGSRELKHLELS